MSKPTILVAEDEGALITLLRYNLEREGYRVLEAQVLGQASVIAYSRVYVLSAVIILAIIPLLVLIRQTRGAGGSQAVME